VCGDSHGVLQAATGAREEVMGHDDGFKLYSMRALGRQDLPDQVTASDGKVFRRTTTIKHDFFAATGFYAADDGTKAVLKMGRTITFWGFPLAWTGRILCRREVRFYTKLADVPNVPAVLGMVGTTGFLHAYVEGRPLEKGKPVPDGFFKQLHELMGEIHRRGIAYVDTNKPENILLGDDGRPHLIDFQISADLDCFLGNSFVARWWLRRMQREDRYHILKHQRRMRPDEMSEAELAESRKRSGLVKLHRAVTKPYFVVRRAIFRWLNRRGWLLPEGSK
jgi:hypothetical protein